MDETREGLLMMYEHSDVFERDLDDLDAMWEKEEMSMGEDDLAVMNFERTYETNWLQWIHQTYINLRAGTFFINLPAGTAGRTTDRIDDLEVPMFVAWALEDTEHRSMYPF